MSRFLTTDFILRAGVAFAFLYPAVSAWFNPYSWVGYFPSFLLTIAGSHQIELLHLFGAVEIVIAVWLLIGKKIFLPSALATVMLFGIVVFNLNQMDVLFRDIPIMMMSGILAFEAFRNFKK